jgi:hypothetical protein
VRSGWVVGLLGVLALAYITANTLRTEGVGSRGPVAGEPLPQFAAPLASSDLEGDANVDGDACRVRGPEVMNVCDLAARQPLVLAFVVPGVGDCERQVDVLGRLAPRFPDVQFAAVAVRGDREAVRERDRRIPVGHDRDGAVANLYGVAVCPFVTFARAGGEVTGSALAFLDEAELTRRVEALR